MRNMNDILRQAQVMQNKLAKLQNELNERTYEASSGGGMVKAVVSGKQELRGLTIDPKALEGGDVEMLQDLIMAAVHEAGRIARETLDREMSAISGGIRLPGMCGKEGTALAVPAGRSPCRDRGGRAAAVPGHEKKKGRLGQGSLSRLEIAGTR